MPDGPGEPTVTTSCALYPILHARLRVHQAPGIPHALSQERRKESCTTRTHSRRENADTRASFPTRVAANHSPLVVPAHAGTHNHREQFWPTPSTSISQHERHGVWVPASAGTTNVGSDATHDPSSPRRRGPITARRS